MAIRYVRADITTLKVESIVNSANPLPIIGTGCDAAIYQAAGAEKLLKERKKIGSIETGEAAATSGFDLCRIIIHTVGPDWIDGQHREFEKLRNCYRNSLQLAYDQQCRSIAFPLISTGVYGFPKDEALKIAVSEINSFLLRHSRLEVILCIFDEESFVLSGKIAETVQELIGRQKALQQLKEEYGENYERIIEKGRKSRSYRKQNEQTEYELSDNQLSFAEMLRYYVNELHEKPSAIYERSWLPRRTYSRIMAGNYQPKKETAIALCLALKLNIAQTIDLLSRNSMALNPADLADRFLLECIRNKKYDLDEINQGLAGLGLYDKIFADRRDIR